MCVKCSKLVASLVSNFLTFLLILGRSQNGGQIIRGLGTNSSKDALTELGRPLSPNAILLPAQ